MLNLSPRHFLEDVDDKESWLVGFIFTDLRGSNCVVRSYKPLVEVKVASDFYSGLCSLARGGVMKKLLFLLLASNGATQIRHLS